MVTGISRSAWAPPRRWRSGNWLTARFRLKRRVYNAGPLKGQRGSKYSSGELFMAGCGALILIMLVGIVITSLLGDRSRASVLNTTD